MASASARFPPLCIHVKPVLVARNEWDKMDTLELTVFFIWVAQILFQLKTLSQKRTSFMLPL